MTPAEAQEHLRDLLADAERAADQARDLTALQHLNAQRARFAHDSKCAADAANAATRLAEMHDARAQALDMAIEALGRA